jgi:CRP-like cAMP-binding protein
MRHQYEEYLRSVPVFSSCSPKELSQIAQLVERVSVKPGDTLVREGTRTNEFFILLEGEAKVTRAGKLLATLGPGRHFGELALLDPAPRNATVSMANHGQVLVLAQREFYTLLRDVPGLVKQLLTGLAQRVHALDGTASATEPVG